MFGFGSVDGRRIAVFPTGLLNALPQQGFDLFEQVRLFDVRNRLAMGCLEYRLRRGLGELVLDTGGVQQFGELFAKGIDNGRIEVLSFFFFDQNLCQGGVVSWLVNSARDQGVEHIGQADDPGG